MYCQKNRGLSETRNVGLCHACGEYVQFVDSDDMLESNTLVYAYHKAQSGELDVFTFNARAVFENPEIEAEKSGHKTYYPRPDTYTDITSGEVFFTRRLRDGKFIMQAMLPVNKARVPF